jgi:predicted Zn-dependent protease
MRQRPEIRRKNFVFKEKYIVLHLSMKSSTTLSRTVMSRMSKNLPNRLLINRKALLSYLTAAGVMAIYITKGILDILESDAEVGFVIAHEMAHVEKKHAVISYRRAKAAAFFTALFFAANNNNKDKTADLFAVVMAQAILRGYSQEMEEEADAVAVAHLKQAGMDYQSYEMVMGKFIDMRQAKIAAIAKIFATHPTPEKRIEHLRKLLQSYQTLQDKLAYR